MRTNLFTTIGAGLIATTLSLPAFAQAPAPGTKPTTAPPSDTAAAQGKPAKGTAGTTTPAGGAATDAGGAKTAGTAPDMATLARLHADNQKEIMHGQMAAKQGKSAQVKSYGRKLASDHKAADKKLLAYLQKAKVDKEAMMKEAVPELEKAKADPAMAKLHGLTGDEFDKEFITMMSAEHQKTIDFVTSTRDGTEDPAFKALLTRLLPTLQKHKEQADKISEKLTKS